MYRIFFIHLSVDGHLGCFHDLVIVNSAAVNIGVDVSFWIMVFSGYMPRGATFLSTYHREPVTGGKHLTHILFLFVFGTVPACGILVPQPGIEPGPQQWKCWVLTTGLPGNSLHPILSSSQPPYKAVLKGGNWASLRSTLNRNWSEAEKGDPSVSEQTECTHGPCTLPLRLLPRHPAWVSLNVQIKYFVSCQDRELLWYRDSIYTFLKVEMIREQKAMSWIR